MRISDGYSCHSIRNIQSRVLGSPSIKIKSLLDPLHVSLLMFRLEVVILWNWAFLICLTVRIEGAEAGGFRERS